MPLQKVNDITIYYEIHGEGEPIILIAGIWSDLSGWKTTIPELSKKFKVIALDTRGAGRTDKPDIPYSIEMMADDTIGLMDALGIGRAHILGASMGSRVAQVIAMKYPDRVKSLVLHVAAARQSLSTLKGLLVLITRFRMRDPHFFDTISAYPPTPASALRQFDAHMAFDSRNWLGKIHAPTLIVNGTKDAIVGPGKFTDELVSGIPGAKLVMVEGTHFFASENPFLLINPAIAFMEDVDRHSRNYQERDRAQPDERADQSTKLPVRKLKNNPGMGNHMENNPGRQDGQPAPARARIWTAITGCVIYTAINAVLLFGSAGTLDWPMAWAFIIISLAVFIAGILRSSPDLLDERSRRHDDSKTWDRVLVSVIAVISFIILIVAGLTVRSGMGGQVPLNVQVPALVILTLGNCLIVWATWTNRFFSATVRLQTDRGHGIVSGGPYRYVRHPGYAGMIVYSLFEPLALGSLPALAPAILAVVLFIVRTYLEDKTLQEELPGYREYSGWVRYRLVPYVW